MLQKKKKKKKQGISYHYIDLICMGYSYFIVSTETVKSQDMFM